MIVDLICDTLDGCVWAKNEALDYECSVIEWWVVETSEGPGLAALPVE